MSKSINLDINFSVFTHDELEKNFLENYEKLANAYGMSDEYVLCRKIEKDK